MMEMIFMTRKIIFTKAAWRLGARTYSIKLTFLQKLKKLFK